MESKERKSSVDILEHVTDGGVHVYGKGSARSATVSQSFHESALGGVVGADVIARTHPLERPRPSAERRARRRRHR